ncbi:hypothetical protein A7K69_02695 [Parageobacillus thermoglucosidasius]|uniref:Uncharacterized protein n=1 Tax=Parageobacillus thermoglucosidasius TaxID=1426 RepID=A0A1B7KWX3_PARTM|nr:hypothetical protein A7K69_02695 [Parageobacillus thermoglucosidasius]
MLFISYTGRNIEFVADTLDSIKFDNKNFLNVQLIVILKSIEIGGFWKEREDSVQYITIERNSRLIKEAKENFKRTHGGKLVCNLDFEKVYESRLYSKVIIKSFYHN